MITPMCADYLDVLYRLSVDRGVARIQLFEVEICRDAFARITEDDRRNEQACYERLFSIDCRIFVESFYEQYLAKLRQCTYTEAFPILSVLIFLQEIAATALWKFNIEIGDKLTWFVREFDRLDVDVERQRLYDFAVNNQRK
jgi:hypothetical protein